MKNSQHLLTGRVVHTAIIRDSEEENEHKKADKDAAADILKSILASRRSPQVISSRRLKEDD